MGSRRVDGGRITPVPDKPETYRGQCLLCPWRTHPDGTTHHLALLAITSHLEAAHRATNCRFDPAASAQ